MSGELLDLMGVDSDEPSVRDELADARAAERLIDTLVALRLQQGLTQAELAVRMDTTQAAVSTFERAGGDPRLSTVQRYARAINARVLCEVLPDDEQD